MRERADADLIPLHMRPAAELIGEGRALARQWQVGSSSFLRAAGVGCEADYKRQRVAGGHLMQHAHIGFRSAGRTREAIAEVHAACAARGVTVDRFGITLDWSMGYPASVRSGQPRGTGIVLDGPEDFQRITDAAPAAAHFGDFMMGLPGAVDNTQAALAAGATAIGNLGQYFTFRLPYWDDDVATTEATVVALGLVAAQEVQVLIHSNLDDGFAGLFSDTSAALGMVLLEKHIVEDLLGASVSHCYGHHFAAPRLRLAFHRALSEMSATPGTMIFGSTVSYRSTAAGNYASLASYLQADIWALRRQATGHAVNPVPVTENERIPDVDEIIDAQIFAGRLADYLAATGTLPAEPSDEQRVLVAAVGGPGPAEIVSEPGRRRVRHDDAEHECQAAHGHQREEPLHRAHALYWQAIYERIPAGRRGDLHRRIAIVQKRLQPGFVSRITALRQSLQRRPAHGGRRRAQRL